MEKRNYRSIKEMHTSLRGILLSTVERIKLTIDGQTKMIQLSNYSYDMGSIEINHSGDQKENLSFLWKTRKEWKSQIPEEWL